LKKKLLKPNPNLDEHIIEWNRDQPLAGTLADTRPGFSSELSSRSPYDEAARYIMHFTEPGDVVLEPQSTGGETMISGFLCSERGFMEHLEYSVDDSGVVSRDLFIPAPPRSKPTTSKPTTSESTIATTDDLDESLDEIFDDMGRQLAAGTRIPEVFSRLGERRVIVTNHSPLAALRAQSYIHDLTPQSFFDCAKTVCDHVRSQSSATLDTTRLINIFTHEGQSLFSEEHIPLIQALRDEIIRSEHAGKLIVPFARTLFKLQSKSANRDQQQDPLALFIAEVKKECNDKPPFAGPALVSLNEAEQIPCADGQIDYVFYHLPNPNSLSERAETSFAAKFEAWLDLEIAADAITDSALLFKEMYRVLKPGKFLTVIIKSAARHELRALDTERLLRNAGFELVENTKTDPPRKNWLVLATMPVTVLNARKPMA
jgi:hypothetical protein